MLVSYTTLVAFLVISVVAAVAMPSQNSAYSTASASNGLSCYKWDFNQTGNGQVVTNLSPQNVGSLNAPRIGVSYRHNVHPTGDYTNPYKVLNVMVIDPYSNTNTPDLRANSGKVLILNGGKHYRLNGDGTPVYDVPGTFNRDNHDGGDLVFDLSATNATQIKFSTIDMGDENDGKGRINNNYYTIVSNGQSERVNLAIGANQVVDNKLVNHPSVKNYPSGIQSFTLHFSGSAALDNLEICNKPEAPTKTPPAPVTNTPVPTVPPVTTTVPKPVECVEKEYRTIISDEFNAMYTKNHKYTYNVPLNDLAKKYGVKVYAHWGWTGADNQKGSVLVNKRVQDNEYHEVITQIKGNYSTYGKSTMFCDDLGNAKSWDDGVGILSDNGPTFNNFQLCRKGISQSNPETTDGIYNGVKVYTPEMLTSYAKTLEITTKLSDDVVNNYKSCVDGAKAKKCNASHYSKVVVETCKKEGTK